MTMPADQCNTATTEGNTEIEVFVGEVAVSTNNTTGLNVYDNMDL